MVTDSAAVASGRLRSLSGTSEFSMNRIHRTWFERRSWELEHDESGAASNTEVGAVRMLDGMR